MTITDHLDTEGYVITSTLTISYTHTRRVLHEPTVDELWRAVPVVENLTPSVTGNIQVTDAVDDRTVREIEGAYTYLDLPSWAVPAGPGTAAHTTTVAFLSNPVAAARELADNLAILGEWSLAADVAASLACVKVDALAAILRLAGLSDAAAAWCRHHAAGDDEGNDHHPDGSSRVPE